MQVLRVAFYKHISEGGVATDSKRRHMSWVLGPLATTLLQIDEFLHR